MAEGRMLKRNISESRRLAELKTDSARLLWTWIIPFLDSEGRFYATPDMIKGKVVPRVETFTLKNIPKYIEDMAAVGLITLYRVDGELLLQYRKFDAFQKIHKDREAAPLDGPDKGEILRIKSRSNPDLVQSKSRLPCSNLKEVNLREVKGTPDLPPVDNSDQDAPPFPKAEEPEEPKKPKEASFKKESKTPSQNTHGERWTDEQSADLDSQMKDILDRYGAKYHQQCFVFVQTYFNRCNPEAMLHCLRRLIQDRLAGKSIPAPGRWLQAVMDAENGKAEARESEQEAEQFKGPIQLDERVKGLIPTFRRISP